MPRTALSSLPFLAAAVTASVILSAAPLPAQELQTNRPSPILLPLPKSDHSFHFIVFGDRTGGPPEGLDVLRQAVTDTNLLNPDLVMTVGDLVPGYRRSEDWLQDAEDYRGIMKNLRMPWFPVAGNHDVYFRGPNRPAGENEALFEKHFGPLWYWFKHKDCGFLTLFSDEGIAGKAKDFTDPDQQHMSAAQQEWLRGALEQMKGLKHVFVFLHHPRWVEKNYPGARWNEVHSLLAAPGNVRAVFAGHVHRLRYDGNRDGIDYITLGTTGGSMPGFYPQAGYMHHMNVVSVRDDGVSVSVLPVGQVMDPKRFTPALIKDVDRLRNTNFSITAPPVTLDKDGLGAGLIEYSITNPVQWPIEVTVLPDGDPRDWISSADHLHLKLEPGQSHSGAFSLIRATKGFEPFTVPAVEFRVEMLAENARIPVPPRRIVLPLKLSGVNDDFFQGAPNRALRLNGKQAARVEIGAVTLPDGPFTVEAWVRPAAAQADGDIISKAEQAEFAINLAGGVPGFHAHIGGKYESAIGSTPVPENVWTHVAGVFDGKRLALFVNGKLTAERAATGPRATNVLPLFLGANPDAKSNPTQFLTGDIDEARLSSTARYTADFTPEAAFTPDAAAVFHFPCDRLAGPFLPSDAPSRVLGSLTEPAASLVEH